ncbi:MAG: hypothetical protein AAF799_08200 [Myxococcota bacterium]
MSFAERARPTSAEPYLRSAPTAVGLGLALLLAACGDERVLGDMAEDPTTGSEGTDEDVAESTGEPEPEPDDGSTDDGGSSETGEPESRCTCVDLDRVCSHDTELATFDCELPEPCGVLHDQGVSFDTVTCVLDLLIDQEPARFRYHFQNDIGTWETETWSGWFYILGPGQGLDNECYRHEIDQYEENIATANLYTLADPSVFLDCIGLTVDAKRACLLAGLEAGDSAPECL